MKEMKHLMGQVEGARAVAMSDYKAFEAFEDNSRKGKSLERRLAEASR